MNPERRKQLQDAIGTLNKAKDEVDSVRSEEQDSYDNLAENFQQGEQGSRMENAIGEMEEVVSEIDTLTEKLEELCQ